MRTHSRDDAAKAQGRTVATSAVPSHEHQERTPIPSLAATPRTRQATEYAGSCATLDCL